jgi:hypothetical protein
MRAALELLVLATTRWPPPGNRRHSLYVDSGGLKLCLWLPVADKDEEYEGLFQSVNLDAEDLELGAEVIVSSIEQILLHGQMAS